MSLVVPEKLPRWVWLVMFAIEFAAIVIVFYITSQPR